MAGLPNFSEPDRKRLAQLGLCEGQIEQLRYARLAVRVALAKRAARNETRRLVDAIAKMADKLLKNMAAVENRISPAHGLAYSLIEQHYGQSLPDDDGGTSFQCLAPRLKALREAARAGKCMLPTTPTRHRTANPEPVKVIAESLYYGWSKQHGSGLLQGHVVDGQIVEEYIHPSGTHSEPYPESLLPSAADHSAFLAIVVICYEAEGSKYEPIAAIKAYLRNERRSRAEEIATIEAAITAADSLRNRTSRKK